VTPGAAAGDGGWLAGLGGAAGLCGWYGGGEAGRAVAATSRLAGPGWGLGDVGLRESAYLNRPVAD
jgi:hypothetical protein